jgi:hypothetical protein
MKIEVLYVPGCPNYRPALERIQRFWYRNRCGRTLTEYLSSAKSQLMLQISPVRRLSVSTELMWNQTVRRQPA